MKRKMSEIEIMFLPVVVPSNIDDDVSALTFGKVLRVSELPHSDKVKFITDENQPVAHVTAVKEEVVATPDAAAAEAAAPAEPEFIKNGNPQTEQERAAAAPSANPA